MKHLPQAELWADKDQLCHEFEQARAVTKSKSLSRPAAADAATSAVVFSARQALQKQPLQLLYVSDHCRELLGVEPETLLDNSDALLQFVDAHDRAAVLASLRLANEQLCAWVCEFRIVSAAGTEKWLQGTAGPHRTPSGSIEWHGVLVDVTARKQSEAAGEDLLHLIDSVPGFIWSAELTAQNEFDFHYISKGALQVFGRPPEYFMYKTPSGWLNIIHEDDVPLLQESLQRVLNRTSTGEEHEYRVRFPDGSCRWVRDLVSMIHHDDGRYMLYGTITDVTAQHEADEMIRQSKLDLERRVDERTAELEQSKAALQRQTRVLESVLACMADGVLVADEQGHFVHFNPAAKQLLGTGAVSEHASHWPQRYGLFLPNQQDMYPADQLPLARARRGETVREAEVFVRNEQQPQGLMLSVNAAPLYSHEGELKGGVAVLRDITDQKRYEERLLAEEALLRKLLELQERDRKLFSYELHDGLLQYVIGAKMIVDALCRQSTGAQLESAEAVRRLLGSAIAEGRAMISGLRPMIIDEQGIVGAISYLISDHSNRGIEIRFTHQVQFDRLDSRLEQTVYRIVQEALTNVRRHSGAATAEVDIRQQGQHLLIEIRDAGAGFDPTQIPCDRFGVRGMQERARLFGGTAQIVSAPGQGTTVRVSIPLDDCG